MKNALIAGIVFAALVVGLLLWKHEGDARRDGKIAVLDSTRVVQAHTIDSLTKHTDSVAAHTVAVADTFTKLDTVWRRHSDTVTATIDRIVHDTVADSTKIRELAALSEETKRKADSTIAAAERLRDSVSLLLTSFRNERAGWVKEKGTLTTEIGLLKRQSRHWGLVGALGYGIHPVDTTDPTTGARHKVIAASPQLTVGLGYRY